MADTVAGASATAVVIVNWRAAEMTLRAVEGAFAQTVPPDHVFVVDNGSDDGSVERLRAGLAERSDRATLLSNDRNLGFGGGCNVAMQAALASGCAYLWLLNNDAMPEPDCLGAMLRHAAHAGGRIGAVGSLLIDPTGVIAPHFGSWMHPAALTCGNVTAAEDLGRRYAWCTAASLLIDAAALGEVGGFDEGFFMYWEDADLNLRLRAAGYTVTCAPDAQVTHHAGTSSMSATVSRYLWHFDSQRRFLRKYHPYPTVAARWLRVKFLLKAAYDRDSRRLFALLAHR